MDDIFGRLTNDGDVALFHETGEVVTRLYDGFDNPEGRRDPLVWPVNDLNYQSGYHDHPQGIIITLEEALAVGVAIEDHEDWKYYRKTEQNVGFWRGETGIILRGEDCIDLTGEVTDEQGATYISDWFYVHATPSAGGHVLAGYASLRKALEHVEPF